MLGPLELPYGAGRAEGLTLAGDAVDAIASVGESGVQDAGRDEDAHQEVHRVPLEVLHEARVVRPRSPQQPQGQTCCEPWREKGEEKQIKKCRGKAAGSITKLRYHAQMIIL